MKRVRMRGVRRNMSWTEIGTAVKRVATLPPKFQALIAPACKRGHKWYAALYIRADKGGAKRQFGYALWIPKPEILAYSTTGLFVGESHEKTVFRYARSHPLARTLKEAHHADVFSDWKRKGFRSHGYPTFVHWLEYREIRKRAGKGSHGFEFWRAGMARRWRDPMSRRGWPKYPGAVYKTAHSNPGRITIQYYRGRSGVIRHWGTGAKGTLPARHVLLVDYKHGGIFDTWMEDGARSWQLVKHLENPRRKRRR